MKLSPVFWFQSIKLKLNAKILFVKQTKVLDVILVSFYLFRRFVIFRPIAAITLLIVLIHLTRSAYEKFKEKQGFSEQNPIPTISITVNESKQEIIPLEPIPSTSFANMDKINNPLSSGRNSEEVQNQEPSTSHQPK